MASIRASITIDLPDNVDYSRYISAIKEQLSKITGLDTRVSVREIDDPISISPIQNIGKIES